MSTAATRMLDQLKKEYILHQYPTDDGKLDGKSVSQKLGLEEGTLFKTLIFESESGKVVVFLLPVELALDTKFAARLIGEKKLHLLPLKDLTRLTGYEKGGCSPFGMKKIFPTYVSDLAKQRESLHVSAGKIGYTLEIKPQLLEELLPLHYFHLEERRDLG